MELNLSKLSADVNDVNSNVVKVRVDEKKVNDDIYKRLNKIEEELYLLNQYSRKNNIIITGVPFNKKEDIYDVVYQVGSALNVEINRCDMYIAHRLPERQKNYPPEIIVRLNNGVVKKNMLENAKRKKISSRQLKLPNCYNDYPIRVKEHLSSESEEVYGRVQQLKDEGKIEDCWCVNGITNLRLNTSDTCKKILGLGHLSRYIEEHLGTAMSSLKLSDSNNRSIYSEGASFSEPKNLSTYNSDGSYLGTSNEDELTEPISSNIDDIRNGSICSENKPSTFSESEVFDDNSNKPEENETYSVVVNCERSMVDSKELKQGESTQKTSSPFIYGRMYSDTVDFNNNYKEPELSWRKSKKELNSNVNTKSYTQEVELLQNNKNKDYKEPKLSGKKSKKELNSNVNTKSYTQEVEFLQHNENNDLDNKDKNALISSSSVMKDLNLECDRKTKPIKYIPPVYRKPYPRREN